MLCRSTLVIGVYAVLFACVLSVLFVNAPTLIRPACVLIENANKPAVTTRHAAEPSATVPDDFIYTPEGQDHMAASRLDPAKLAPLTPWVQAWIHRHQHPQRCDRVMISDGWFAGFGSEIHVMGTHLAHAIETGHVLVMGADGCRNMAEAPCPDGGSRCACFFRAWSNCTPSAASPHVSSAEHRLVVPTVFVAALRQKVPGMSDEQVRYWWRAQSAAYLARLNDDTVRHIRAMRMDPKLLQVASGQLERVFPFPPATINPHIRSGDKFREMRLIGPPDYVAAGSMMIDASPLAFQQRSFFVSGDDLKSIEEACSAVQRRGWLCFYSKIPRMPAGFYMEKLQVSMGDNVTLADFTRAVLLQLTMSLEADYWIGTRGSNWNRLIDELRCVWVDKCHGSYREVGEIQDYEW